MIRAPLEPGLHVGAAVGEQEIEIFGAERGDLARAVFLGGEGG